MRTALSYIISLCIALWLGGLVTLFIALMSIFQYNRGLGAQVGPVLFSKFEPYQLSLGAIAIACTIAWRMYACSRARKMLLACLLAGMAIAVINFAYITPQIIDLWQNPTEGSAERFHQLHQMSRRLYTGTAVLVLLAGGALVKSLREESETRYIPSVAAVAPTAG